MPSSKRWLARAPMAALVLVGAAVAQPPGPGQQPLPGFVQPARISVDDIVERIMSFDKNKDGKVTRDELPERMHGLIARGDTNNDGALDRDEIRKLASTPAGLGPPGGFGVGGFRAKGRVGPGPGGPVTVRDGPGPGGPGGGFRFGSGPGLDDIEGVVDDLKLSAQKKDRAAAAVKAHRESVRKLMDQARAELLQKMKEILSEEELNDFKAALDRPRSGTTIINVGPGGPLGPGDVIRKRD
jgi:collagen type III alpha